MQASQSQKQSSAPWFGLSQKLLFRELRRGELTIIALAIVLAVMTVFTLTAVTSRIQGAIMSKSAEFIAADRIIASSRPISEDYLVAAKQHNLKSAQTLYFSTMAASDEDMALSSVKAVTAEYPLRGKLEIADSVDGVGYITEDIPATGEVWAAKRLFFSLGINVGDTVQIGVAKFKVSKLLANEPDGSVSLFNASPRIIINYADIERTQVIQPGSRLSYDQLYAGDDADIDAFIKDITPDLSEHERIWSVKDRASQLSGSLKRSERFLLLAGLLGIVLAATALAVAANRYCQRHYDPVAIFKTLGAGKAQIRKIYFSHLITLTTVAVIVGLFIGYQGQVIALDMMASYLPDNLPDTGLRPYLLAAGTGIVCAIMFSLFPIIKLLEIPPLRVLRRNSGDDIGMSGWHTVLSLLTIFGLMWGFSQQLKLSIILFVGGLFIIAVLLGLSYLFINSGRAIGMKTSSPFALAIASIKRRAQSNSIQLISFTIAIQLLLTLYVLKNDIINEWQAQLPEGTPNHFLVNISQNEMPEMKQFFSNNGIQDGGLFPVVRGRLIAIGDEALTNKASKEEDEESDQGRRQGVGRELNLTWLNEMPENNTLLEGTWHGDKKNEAPNNDAVGEVVGEVSVEDKLAARLKITLGDELTFLVGASEAKVRVTSIRKVNWNSMQPNFFMILSDNVLERFPATYITSFHLADSQPKLINQLLTKFPTVSIIEVDKIIKQIQSVISQVSLAIEFVLFVVVIAGVLVLTAQVQASMEERQQELVILRALGAKGRLIKLSVASEFFLLGGIAGVIATLATELVLFGLQTQMFNMSATLHWPLWWIGPVVGASFVCLVGLALTAKLMTVKTAQLLRLIA